MSRRVERALSRGGYVRQELQLIGTPLAKLSLEQARPPREALTQIMEQLRTGKGLTAPAGGG
jgi:hypothetical protein